MVYSTHKFNDRIGRGMITDATNDDIVSAIKTYKIAVDGNGLPLVLTFGDFVQHGVDAGTVEPYTSGTFAGVVATLGTNVPTAGTDDMVAVYTKAVFDKASVGNLPLVLPSNVIDGITTVSFDLHV